MGADTERKEEEKNAPASNDRGVCTREELTQTQLEDQHFSFAGKSEIDIRRTPSDSSVKVG